MAKAPLIAICSSTDFYRQVNEIEDKLEARGYRLVVPDRASEMRQHGNYAVDAVKPWYQNAEHFIIKAKLIHSHFAKIAKADAILVVNNEKNGQPGYIGGNTLMEMGVAFYLHKPIYVLNDVLETAPFYEEVFGMGVQILEGDLTKLDDYLLKRGK